MIKSLLLVKEKFLVMKWIKIPMLQNFKISALQNINSDDLKVQALLTRPFTKILIKS